MTEEHAVAADVADHLPTSDCFHSDLPYHDDWAAGHQGILRVHLGESLAISADCPWNMHV